MTGLLWHYSRFHNLMNHSGHYSPIFSGNLSQKLGHSLYQRPHRLPTPEMRCVRYPHHFQPIASRLTRPPLAVTVTICPLPPSLVSKLPAASCPSATTKHYVSGAVKSSASPLHNSKRAPDCRRSSRARSYVRIRKAARSPRDPSE